MSKIVVLGAGLVGKAIAIDLAKRHNVTSVDINEEALKALPNIIETKVLDLSNLELLKTFVQSFD